jgi:prepilin-type N-terminal cleavage/methylation domain-containing protein
MMRHRIRFIRAFTLIELLTVISIIGVLAALLIPAIKNALIKAEYARAQSGIANLNTALTAYYTEYGKWPITDTSLKYNSFIIDANFVALLQGQNVTAPPPTGYNYPIWSGSFGTIAGATYNGNPHGIHFLDFKASDLDVGGTFIDPWKRAYYVRFDYSYANQVEDPFTGGSVQKTNLTAGFLTWSAGPDSQYDNGGDTIPNTTPVSAANKDNVASWR